MSKRNESAFPGVKVVRLRCGKTVGERNFKGLSKREYIATHLLQGLIATVTIGRGDHMDLLCTTAVAYADRLMAELEEKS